MYCLDDRHTMITPRSIQTIAEQIVHELRRDILAGILKEDEPLREQDLSERFGVSRGPIRAALQELAREGLAIAVPNIGVRVAPPPHAELRPVISQIRRSIECFVLEKVFDTLDEKRITQFEDILKALYAACEQKDIQMLQNHERRFHSTFLELYGERRLYNIWHSTFTWMIFSDDRYEDTMRSYYEHKELLAAIRNRDMAKAIEWIELHIQ